MSKNDKKELPYVEPNSGAAPQPGGFVAFGSESVMPAGSDTPAVPDNDPQYEAKQGEASKAVEGENPNKDGQQGDTSTETPDGEAGEQEQGTPTEEEEAASEEQGGSEEEEQGGDAQPEPAPEEKDYSELLEKNVPDVQKYLDEHPDEAGAVKAAEKKGKGRAGVLEH